MILQNRIELQQINWISVYPIKQNNRTLQQYTRSGFVKIKKIAQMQIIEQARHKQNRNAHSLVYEDLNDINDVTLQTVKSQHALKFQIEYLRQKITEFQAHQEAMKQNYLRQYKDLMKNSKQLRSYNFQPTQNLNDYSYQRRLYHERQLSPVHNLEAYQPRIYHNYYQQRSQSAFREQTQIPVYNRNQNILQEMRYLQDLKNNYSANSSKPNYRECIEYSDEDQSVNFTLNNADSTSNAKEDKYKGKTNAIIQTKPVLKDCKNALNQPHKERIRRSQASNKSSDTKISRTSSKNKKAQLNTYFNDLKELKDKIRANKVQIQIERPKRINVNSYKKSINKSMEGLKSYFQFKQSRQNRRQIKTVNESKIANNIKNRVIASSCIINKIDHANLSHNTKNVQQRYQAQKNKKTGFINEFYMHLQKTNKKYAYPLFVKNQRRE